MLQEEAAEAEEELFAVAEEETSADVLRLTPDEEDSVEEASDALQTYLRNHQQADFTCMMIARILSRRRPRSFPLVLTIAVLHLVQLERCRLALFCGSCFQFLVTIHGPKESVSCFSWRMGCCGSEKHLSRALLISSLLSMARFFDRLNSCFSECFLQQV
mmetsp:Transcript_8077/g.27056  ORF Transcript_8077/g.27056 Transcript_8077/m.27056 type:complete len:160 (-) Transcript_8077:651-1130(-)